TFLTHVVLSFHLTLPLILTHLPYTTLFRSGPGAPGGQLAPHRLESGPLQSLSPPRVDQDVRRAVPGSRTGPRPRLVLPGPGLAGFLGLAGAGAREVAPDPRRGVGRSPRRIRVVTPQRCRDGAAPVRGLLPLLGVSRSALGGS